MDTILAQFEPLEICYESSIKLLRCGLIRSKNLCANKRQLLGQNVYRQIRARTLKKVCDRTGGQRSGSRVKGQGERSEVRDQRSGVRGYLIWNGFQKRVTTPSTRTARPVAGAFRYAPVLASIIVCVSLCASVAEIHQTVPSVGSVPIKKGQANNT